MSGSPLYKGNGSFYTRALLNRGKNNNIGAGSGSSSAEIEDDVDANSQL